LLRNDVLRAGARFSGRNPGRDPGPVVVDVKPKRPKRSRRVEVDEDEPDLIAAK